MATNYGVNATKSLNTLPAALHLIGQSGGNVKSIYDSFTQTADLAIGDKIILGAKIPAGARIVDCKLVYGAFGGSGAVSVGWLAGPSAAEAASANGFAVSTLVISSAGSYSMFTTQPTSAAVGKVFTEECQIQLVTTVDTTSTDKSISIEVTYVID